MKLSDLCDALSGAAVVILVMLACVVVAVLGFTLAALWRLFTLPSRLLDGRKWAR
jgi:hypothetical protein